MKKYDYIIVGAGLWGATFAHLVNKAGKKCLIIDKRSHKGGNIYCENVDGINVHKYGAHIFHTSNDEVWEFVTSLVEFNRYTNSPMANYKGELYNLPFNMNTFYQLWGVKTPIEAQAKIEEQRLSYAVESPSNLEEQAISLVGKDIYEKLIKGYTEKQWGRLATELPAFIIKRLPVRFTFDNNYFNDKYQGIPIGGYNVLTDKLLEGVEVLLEEDYFTDRFKWNSLADKIVFTGKIDEFYNYQYGKLEYRSLRFEHEQIFTDNYQGNAVINYTESEVPYTRIIEHKHFDKCNNNESTVITKEYPSIWKEGLESYYPINDDLNNHLYEKYEEISKLDKNVIFGGRLAQYKYFDMHHIIEQVFLIVKEQLK